MALNSLPLAGQTLNASRTLIKANFDNIQSANLVDHEDYATAGQGKHTHSTYVQQTYAAPILGPSTVGSDDQVVFARDSLQSPGSPGLFLHPANTANTVAGAEFSYALPSANGYTILPSGIWLAWGMDTIPQNFSGKTVTLAFSFPNGFLSASVTPTLSGIGSATNLLGWIPSVTLIGGAPFNTFQVSRIDNGQVSTNVPFRYLAIGY